MCNCYKFETNFLRKFSDHEVKVNIATEIFDGRVMVLPIFNPDKNLFILSYSFTLFIIKFRIITYCNNNQLLGTP